MCDKTGSISSPVSKGTGVSTARANLCQYCADIVRIRKGGHTTRPFYSDWSRFRDRITVCETCSYLEDQLIGEVAEGPGEGIELKVRVKEPHESSGGILWALLEISLRFAADGIYRKRTHTFSMTTYYSNVNAQSIELDFTANSDDCIALIKDWFENCEASHGEQCRPKVARLPEQLPARLIDVSAAGCDPRLVSTVDLGDRELRYATLSHRWASENPLRTTKSNLARFRHSIPSYSIPDTFANAIKVTRALGIRYLWIDALCIIQNSREDWKQEAVKMKHVYSQSCVNIASSLFETCPNDASKDVEPRFFRIRSLQGGDSVIKLQLGDTREMSFRTNLSTRGWILQEQLLSPRLLSIMPSEMHWRCADILRSSTGVQFQQYPIQLCGIGGILQRAMKDVRHIEWRQWMRDYSRRSFTFWEDRVPALHGMIQFYQGITGDIPLLGLWRTSFADDLLWIDVSHESRGSMPPLELLNLPTWSWLSRRGALDWDIWQITITSTQQDPYVIEHDHCELLDHAIRWNGAPFVSTIETAYLILRGPIVSVTIQLDDNEHPLDATHFVVSKCGAVITCCGQIDQDVVAHRQHSLLLLRSRLHTETLSRREIFLVLEPATNTESYRRVGIGCAWEKLFGEERSVQEICLR